MKGIGTKVPLCHRHLSTKSDQSLKAGCSRKKVHPLLFLINFQVQIDPNLSRECYMIETTRKKKDSVGCKLFVLSSLVTE